jgi:fibrillarin-like pre-rRNA processing protein
MNPKEIFPGVYQIENFLATINLTKGKRVYKERLFNINGIEYREWNCYNSKLAAAIKKGLKTFPFKPDSIVLYLGASTGTTVSHISDILVDGLIFAVEFAQRPMRELLFLSQERKNIIPIFADASKPELYMSDIDNLKINILYQDVAQPNQAEILLKNSNLFLTKNSDIFLCIKSQSIDVLKSPKEVYNKVIEELEKNGLKTIQTIDLEPFDRDHLFWYGKKVK